eukprot:sb/3477359/
MASLLQDQYCRAFSSPNPQPDTNLPQQVMKSITEIEITPQLVTDAIKEKDLSDKNRYIVGPRFTGILVGSHFAILPGKSGCPVYRGRAYMTHKSYFCPKFYTNTPLTV